MVAEYLLTEATPTSPVTSYLTNDTLGSPRVITDASGNIISRRDFMPFGEEISAIGGRTSGLGYQVDATRQKFTGYERDSETDLDFAQARMYQSRLGRFTVTDPILMSEDRAFDPQQINLYIYARNNPYKYVDPKGEDIDDSSLKDNKDYQKWKEAFLATDEGKAMWDKYNDDKNFKLTISMGDNKGGKQGAETIITKDSFNSEGKLVSSAIIIGTEFAKSHPTDASDYPILSKMTESDSSGGYGVSRLSRAVGILAHEFGHVMDADKVGGEKWLKENALIEQNNANYKAGKGLDSPDLVNQCGCRSISDISTNRENRAEGYTIKVIEQHYKKQGDYPGRVRDAIKEYKSKYGTP